MAIKYKLVLGDMFRQNQGLFDNFKTVHDNFAANPEKYRVEFNQIGEDIQNVIRRYENQLCKHTESGGFGKYSTNLSEKFWEEIRKIYPKIDEIGIR